MSQGTLFNKVDTNAAEITQLKETCTMYFNLLALFFPENVNFNSLDRPYHAELLYKRYKVGFGIISLQQKSQNIQVSS